MASLHLACDGHSRATMPSSISLQMESTKTVKYCGEAREAFVWCSLGVGDKSRAGRQPTDSHQSRAMRSAWSLQAKRFDSSNQVKLFVSGSFKGRNQGPTVVACNAAKRPQNAEPSADRSMDDLPISVELHPPYLTGIEQQQQQRYELSWTIHARFVHPSVFHTFVNFPCIR